MIMLFIGIGIVIAAIVGYAIQDEKEGFNK
jgi:hypothetical protein